MVKDPINLIGTKCTVYWQAKVNWQAVNIFYLFCITSDRQDVKHDRGGGQNFRLVAEARRLRPRSKFWSWNPYRGQGQNCGLENKGETKCSRLRQKFWSQDYCGLKKTLTCLVRVSALCSLQRSDTDGCVTVKKPCFINSYGNLFQNTHTRTTILRPFFRDYLVKPVPAEIFLWTLRCKGR